MQALLVEAASQSCYCHQPRTIQSGNSHASHHSVLPSSIPPLREIDCCCSSCFFASSYGSRCCLSLLAPPPPSPFPPSCSPTTAPAALTLVCSQQHHFVLNSQPSSSGVWVGLCALCGVHVCRGHRSSKRRTRLGGRWRESSMSACWPMRRLHLIFTASMHSYALFGLGSIGWLCVHWLPLQSAALDGWYKAALDTASSISSSSSSCLL